MTDRVPEFALVTAGVLGGAFGGFVAWVDSVTTGLVVGALLAYPFAAFAVSRDETPTTVLPARPVAVCGVALGVVPLVGLGLDPPRPGRGAASLLAAVALGAVLAAPPLAYATRYGRGGPPPRPVVLAGVGVGTLLLLAAAVVDAPAGVVAGTIVGLAAAGYGTDRGLRISRETRVRAIAGGLLVGTVVAGLAVAGHVGTLGGLTAAVGFVLGPAVFHAATA